MTAPEAASRRDWDGPRDGQSWAQRGEEVVERRDEQRLFRHRTQFDNVHCGGPSQHSHVILLVSRWSRHWHSFLWKVCQHLQSRALIGTHRLPLLVVGAWVELMGASSSASQRRAENHLNQKGFRVPGNHLQPRAAQNKNHPCHWQML